ncbi:MAG: hypothetical protein KAU35_10630 [candidate division Zixibacteria bacterium]|nr:hypothetical protein [candidate division Zixibacteria bacterium]
MAVIDRQLILAFSLTVLVRLVFHLLTGFTYDDAFITFRYAENIAAGHGFVYNVGERVLGTTTPLFTLILSAVALAGIPIKQAALVIGLAATGFTAAIIHKFALSLGFDRWAFVPVTLYVLFPRLFAPDTGGMETALFTLLVTASFYCQHRRFPIHAVALAALASVTRPEGFLLLGLLVAWNVFKDTRRIAAYLLIPVLISGPWLVFAAIYFGSPIPNSILGKLALYSQFGTKTPWDSLVYLMGWHNPFGLALFALALVGGRWLWKRQRFGLLEAIWLIGMVGSLSLCSTALFPWYVTPIYPVYLLFAGAAVLPAAVRLTDRRLRLGLVRGALLVVMVVVFIAACHRTVSYHQSYQDCLDTVHYAIGMYLRENAQSDDVVAAEDIGYMGYYSGLRIIDRDGLVSPETIPYSRRGDHLGLILDYSPDWVVVGLDATRGTFLEDQRFLDHYQLEKLYEAGFGSEYRIYSLIP